MEAKDTKKELEAAYASLEKAERQIKSLLLEKNKMFLTLEMLEKACFIKEGKLAEAREFVDTFCR